MKIRYSGKVNELFNNVAQRYDLLNDLLSFGLHRVWKRKLLKSLDPLPGEKWIDLCCGTGDIAISLASNINKTGTVLGIDFSDAQLICAREKALRKDCASISWLNQDVLNNCLPSNSFDGVVMAYGLRNLSSTQKGIEEIYRLLQSGGRAGILDFNPSLNGILGSWFQKFYLRKVVVPIASIFKLREEYSYLEDSLKNFPNASLQKEIARNTGFINIRYEKLAGGQMGILFLQKS